MYDLSAWTLVITGVARIFQRGGGGGQSEGAKRHRGQRVYGGGVPLPPSQGREIFENSCIKMTVFAHNFFFLSFLLSDQREGGGGHGPLCPP